MLTSLHIRNLVLVPDLLIEFAPGFNTITGETGAGKSLIIGALALLAGGRASPALIRKGEKSCEVSASIHISPNHQLVKDAITHLLEQYGLPPCEEDELLIRRSVTENGSRGFINGSAVTAAVMKTFGELLIDIHGPNDNQSLLQPARQLKLLDLYGGHQAELSAVSACWNRLSKVRKELQSLEQNELAPEEFSLLSHQLKVIEAARLQADEEPQLLAQHKLAANSVRLRELAGLLTQELSQSDQSVVEALAPCIRAAEEFAELDPEHGEGFVQRLNAISEELSELSDDISSRSESLDIDDEALNAMEERIELIQKLRRRFGPTLQDVLDTAARLRQRLEAAGTRNADLERLRTEEQSLQNDLKRTCAALTDARMRAALALAPAITEKLRRLGFLKAIFEVRRSSVTPGANGADAIEFYFAPNLGEMLQPLRHSASSGEIARVMLAIKTVLTDVDEMPIIVFDEIDANIGGRTAAAVAAELHAVGAKHQVFSITHLPLIAAAGDRHYLVEKHVDNERTIAAMTRLEGESRVAEIVRMLGAQPEDTAARTHAQEMLAAPVASAPLQP